MKYYWPDIAEMSTKGDVEGLIQILQGAQGCNVRAAAGRALGDLGQARAIEPLVATLQDGRGDVREIAAEVLSKLCWQPDTDAARIAYWIAQQRWEECVAFGRQAVEPLIAILKDEDWTVRRAAAKALGEIGDAWAAEPLIALLQDQSDLVRKVAAEALARLGWQPDASEIGAAYWATLGRWDKCVELGVLAVKPLVAALKVMGGGGWDGAIAVLKEIGGGHVVDALIAALQDESGHLREAAAKALGEIGDARTVEPLIAALGDENGWVRLTVIWSLEKIGGPAVPPLIAALRNREANREGVAKALGVLGDVRAVKPLIAILNDEAGSTRQAAAEALGKIGDRRAVKPLIAALKDKSGDVRAAAAHALGKIGDARAVKPLIATLKKDGHRGARGAAAIALGKIGKMQSLEPLLEALKDQDESVRRATIWGLAKIGDPRVVRPVIAALKDRHSDVREAAAKALGWIGDARAVEPLIAALEDERVRAAAARALGEIGDVRAVEPLISILKDKLFFVREATVEALAEIGDARAVGPLIAALSDVSSKVRKAAAKALDDLAWQPDASEAGAAYWIAKQQWDKCVEIGAPAVAPLIAVLEDENWEIRMAAAKALDKLAWQPDTSESGVAYWIAKQQWDKCVELGAPAVEPLLGALLDDNVDVRSAAVESLERIYKSGQLDDAHKSKLSHLWLFS